MREVDRLKIELAQAVAQSDEYKNYRECKNRLDQNPGLARAVSELRKQNFELQNSEIEDGFEAVQNIKQRFDYVHSQDLAKDFLQAELSLCRMVQDIYRTIIEDIEFDLDFLE